MDVLIFRIKPDCIRSHCAFLSQAHIDVVDIPAVIPSGRGRRSKEMAASLAHASCMRRFLDTDHTHTVVLEDDAILEPDCSWMTFKEFDIFIPFSQNRRLVAPNTTIDRGRLPRRGAFAYLCSRRYAGRYLPYLLAGEKADRASHLAATGLVCGSFVGNLVNHDNTSFSMISERRRKMFLRWR